MKWNAMAMLPLVTKLGDLLKEGFEHYAAAQASGITMNADTLTLFIALKMSSWDPKVGDKKLLDPDTRNAAARFLAGVAMNMVK